MSEFSQEVGALLEDAFVNTLVIGDVDGKKSNVRGILSTVVPSTVVPSTVVPVSNEQLADAQEFGAALGRYLSATPAERAAAAEAAQVQRVAEREVAECRPLTLEALLDKLGFTREYAEHLVQPYCECYDGMDGWEYCQQARDEGLTP